MKRYCEFYSFGVVVLLWVMLSVSADAGTATNQFSAITAAAQPINSVFDGLAPSQKVRNALLPKNNASAISGAFTLNSSTLSSSIVAGPRGNACPTGGICAQPGTISVPGQFCEDDFGCGVDVHNQGNTNDFTQGTDELYDCTQCCVDWFSCSLGGGFGGGGGGCGGDSGYAPDCPDPMIIDVDAEGFHLTSIAAGVTFDISGTGHPTQIAWTDSRFHNAFLALPGSDGLVHNGKELFGNFTPQPPSSLPNGFLALAEFDKPANGGNGDGIIDQRDAVFSRLRLWIDENHDGICQPNELHKLPEFGVSSLALNYTESGRTDEFGNQFRYRARVDPIGRRDPRDTTASGAPGRWTYDVFFNTQ